MKKNRKMFAIVLAVRLFIAWWLAATFLFGLLAILLDSLEFGIILGCVFFPWICTAVAVIGSLAQYRSFKKAQYSMHLESFQQAFLHVPLATQAAVKEVLGILSAELGATECRMQGRRVRADFLPPGERRWWKRLLLADVMLIEILPVDMNSLETGGCSLEICARPARRLIYGFLWIDRGRNYWRIRKFQELIALRTVKREIIS